MAAGETLAKLWCDPAMPGRATYTYWRRTQPGFAEAVWRLRQGQLQRLGRADGGVVRFDPAAADRIVARLFADGSLERVLAADPALPCSATVRRWRREQPEFGRRVEAVMQIWRRKRRRRDGCSHEMTQRIVKAILKGHSLFSLSRRADMPSQGTLYRWARTKPEFARAVWRASDMRDLRLVEEIDEIAGTVRPGTVTATRRRMSPLVVRLGRLSKRPGLRRASRLWRAVAADGDFRDTIPIPPGGDDGMARG